MSSTTNFFAYWHRLPNIKEGSTMSETVSQLGYSWTAAYAVISDLKRMELITQTVYDGRTKKVKFTKEMKELQKAISKMLEIYEKQNKEKKRKLIKKVNF